MPPRSAVARVPVSMADHCWLMPPQKILKYSKHVWLSLLWGLWILVLVCTRFCLSPSSITGGYGVWFYTQFSPSCYPVVTSPLPLGEGYLFLVGSRIILSMAVQQLIANLEFSQEKMSTYASTPPSCVRYKLTISSKWIKNLNVTPNAVKFLAENVGRTLSDINFISQNNGNKNKNKQMGFT